MHRAFCHQRRKQSMSNTLAPAIGIDGDPCKVISTKALIYLTEAGQAVSLVQKRPGIDLIESQVLAKSCLREGKTQERTGPLINGRRIRKPAHEFCHVGFGKRL